MFKATIGLLAGLLLAGALFAGPLSPLPMRAESGDAGTDPTVGDGISASATIVEILNRAAGDITETDTATFYQKLVDSYQLEESAAGAGTLPDIDNITRQAITMPLLEAGETIRDSEIAEFYRDFLVGAGLTDAAD